LETRLHWLVRGLFENGAVAGSHTRTSSLAGRHSAVKSQPQTYNPKMTERRTSVGFILLFLLAVLTQTGCGLVPENVSLSDSRVQPLLKAMEQVDRPSLGFTPVTTNAQIKLETHSLAGSYDAMLHVYGATSRTIAFRKTATGYRWTAEQEIYQGPKWWQTMDGTFREEMIIEYQTERVNGIPTNQLSIRYQGSDTNLEGREFTLAEVRPILEKWKTSPVESRNHLTFRERVSIRLPRCSCCLCSWRCWLVVVSR
jgi:hypothetical protein